MNNFSYEYQLKLKPLCMASTIRSVWTDNKRKTKFKKEIRAIEGSNSRPL